LLGFVGFQANVMQTAESLTGIRMMLSFFPAIGTALSVLFIAFYPLNEKKLMNIVSELNEQRKQA
jgi:GPH family glycoside/pentoside/hexuronide:cation symporter